VFIFVFINCLCVDANLQKWMMRVKSEMILANNIRSFKKNLFCFTISFFSL